MNILISAYACCPNHGSEEGMVWRVASTLASNNEVYVITDDESKSEIEAEINKLNLNHLHFFYNPVPPKVREMCNNQGDWRFYYYYRLWQKKTLQVAKDVIKNHRIDVVHQLGMITFREPGYLLELGKPFVWGPIGGMNTAPVRYLKGLSTKHKIKYHIKNCITKFQYRFIPRIVKTINNADILIAANSSSYKVLTNIYKKEVFKINETGCDYEIINVNKLNHNNSLDILWVGRFLPTKLLGFSLEVIKGISNLPNVHFHVIGAAFDDDETLKYKEYAKALGIDSICNWHGWVSHDEVQKLMLKSDFMFFPSVVEGTPHVVLEAVANNLPVVCFDACGQADIIDETIGIKIPLSDYNQSMHEFESIIKDLYYDRKKLQTLSDNCNSRKKALSWDVKIKQYNELYLKAISKKNS